MIGISPSCFSFPLVRFNLPKSLTKIQGGKNNKKTKWTFTLMNGCGSWADSKSWCKRKAAGFRECVLKHHQQNFQILFPKITPSPPITYFSLARIISIIILLTKKKKEETKAFFVDVGSEREKHTLLLSVVVINLLLSIPSIYLLLLLTIIMRQMKKKHWKKTFSISFYRLWCAYRLFFTIIYFSFISRWKGKGNNTIFRRL